MLTAIIVGAVIGFVLAMPPGPVGVTAMKLGINNGIKAVLYMSIGSGFLDIVFSIVAIFAASATVSALSGFTQDYPIFTVILQITIVLAFIIFGIRNLRKKDEAYSEDEVDSDLSFISRVVKLLKEKGPFFLGVGIALANIANPSFLPSLAYIAMQVHQLNIFESNFWNNVIFSVGFGFGNFLWLYLLASLVIKLKEKFSDTFILRVRQFAGITFISFGGILGWRLVFFTKWAEILRLALAF